MASNSDFSFGLGLGMVGTSAVAIVIGFSWAIFCMTVAGIIIIISGYLIFKKEREEDAATRRAEKADAFVNDRHND